METRIFENTTEDLKAAAQLIKKGEAVIFPTETVYGLGANALDTLAVEKIFKAKGRPSDNPLIVHISKAEDMDALADEIPQGAVTLAEKFWPGPLTIILKKKPCVPDTVSAGLAKIDIE